MTASRTVTYELILEYIFFNHDPFMVSVFFLLKILLMLIWSKQSGFGFFLDV